MRTYITHTTTHPLNCRRRPSPRGSASFGAWDSILSGIAYLAVAVNAALLCLYVYIDIPIYIRMSIQLQAPPCPARFCFFGAWGSILSGIDYICIYIEREI